MAVQPLEVAKMAMSPSLVLLQKHLRGGCTINEAPSVELPIILLHDTLSTEPLVTQAGSNRCVDRVMNCVSLFVCLFALYKENGLSYQNQTL